MQHHIRIPALRRSHLQLRPCRKFANYGVCHRNFGVVFHRARLENWHRQRMRVRRQMCSRPQRVVSAAAETQQAAENNPRFRLRMNQS